METRLVSNSKIRHQTNKGLEHQDPQDHQAEDHQDHQVVVDHQVDHHQEDPRNPLPSSAHVNHEATRDQDLPVHQEIIKVADIQVADPQEDLQDLQDLQDHQEHQVVEDILMEVKPSP